MGTHDRRRLRRRPRRQADVSRFAVLLVVLVATIGLLGLVGLPRPQDDPSTPMRIAVMLLAAAILFATIRITRASDRSQRTAGFIVGIIAVVGTLSFLVGDSLTIMRAVGVLWVLMVIATPVVVLREVISSERVTLQTIIGAICVYLLFGIALTFLAMAIDAWGVFFEEAPRSTAYVYFAFVTITTVGYGDLSPFSDVARLISVLFAVSGQMYLVIVVARLVSVWNLQPADDGPET